MSFNTAISTVKTALQTRLQTIILPNGEPILVYPYQVSSLDEVPCISFSLSDVQRIGPDLAEPIIGITGQWTIRFDVDLYIQMSSDLSESERTADALLGSMIDTIDADRTIGNTLQEASLVSSKRLDMTGGNVSFILWQAQLEGLLYR